MSDAYDSMVRGSASLIGFSHCSKHYRYSDTKHIILDDVSWRCAPSDKVSILAHNGTGKTSIIRMLAGIEPPNAGEILRGEEGEGMIWQLGYAGILHPYITGEANIRIIAQLNEVNAEWLCAYVEDFAELGDSFRRPLTTYSGGMRARLAYALSMALPVTTYLADDKLSTGDQRFNAKCEAALEQKLESAGLILITRNPRIAQRFAEKYGVLHEGKLRMCESFEQAESIFYQRPDEIADIETMLSSLQQI